MQIRLATIDDLPALNALIPLSVRQLSVGFYTTDQIRDALEHMFGVDTRLIQDQTYYVAEAEGTLVGCGGWSRRRTLFGGDQWQGVDASLLDPRTEAARIRAFFVHPDWARRGIGRRVLQVCEEAARGAGFRRFELVATLPGEPLYAAFGYRAVERVEIALSNGTTLPAVRMEKKAAEKGADRR